MTFAQVKSNPWERKRKRRKPRFRLWSDDEWKVIVAMVKGERRGYWREYVAQLNERLYGKRDEL